MANVKITDLTALSATDVASNDVLPIVDINVDQTKKIAIADLITATSAANDFITFTQLNANLNVLDANADAIEARRDANVTVMNTADTALQTRLTTNVTAFTAEDVRINANLDVVQDNVAAVEARRTANVTVMNDADTALQARLTTNVSAFTAEDTALQARLTTNVSAFTAEDTALQVRINANSLSAASNDFITFTRLNANIDVVQDNVAGLTSTLTIRGDNASDDAVTLGSETLTFKGDTGLTTTVSSNTVTIDLDDTAVTAGLYGGVSGGTTNVTALTIDATGRITNAANVSVVTNLDTIQDNVVRVQQNAASNTDAVEARRVANIAGAISTVLTSDLTASRALLSSGSGKIAVSDVTSTELGHLDGVTSAVQTQLDSKIATTDSASNDFVTFTRLDANINAVSSNSAAVEARRVANIAGAISTGLTADLTASRAMVTNGSGKIAASDVTSTELGHLDGVTGAIQTQIDSKIATTDSASNDFITFTRLDANINSVSSNVAAVEARRTANIAGAVSTITTSDLTASRAMVTNGSGKVAASAVTATELGHLDGVTGAIQTQIDGKQATITGAATTIDDADLTVSRALVSSDSGKVAVSAVTSTELGHLDGVSGAIQTQLDAKAALAGATFSGQVNMSDDLVVTGNLIVNGDTTTANSVNLIVQDRMVMLANSATGAPSADVGFLFNRGNQGNAAFFYDESASTFKLSDTKDPSSNTALSPVTASNLDVGIITVATVDATAIKQNGATLDNLIGSNVDGAISTVNDTDLTASRALVSSSGGKIEVSAVTATEIGHLDGVTSAIQTQIDSKQATITGAATTIDDADLTASRALLSSGSGKVAVSDVTSTELGHLDGVTSSIQTQINGLETRRDANVTVAASNNAALESRRTANIAGAVSTILTSDLTASRAMVTNSSGKVAVSAVTATELGHLDGVTSAIQTQIDSKQATISGAATTIDDADLTASRALVSSGSGKVAVSDVTSTELGHLDGVTSAIQTQFTGAETRRTNNIAGAISTVTTADLTASRALVSGSGGKIEVSAITSTELGHLDGITQNINSNLEALASGIAGAAGGAFPTGDYGLLDASNTATDSFGQTTGSLTTFDMLSAPSGSLATEDLGALS